MTSTCSQFPECYAGKRHNITGTEDAIDVTLTNPLEFSSSSALKYVQKKNKIDL